MSAPLLLPERLTHADAGALWRSLSAQLDGGPATAPVVVDASALRVFDSSAVALLLALRRRAIDQGRSYGVAGLVPRLKELAGLYGVTELLQG